MKHVIGFAFVVLALAVTGEAFRRAAVIEDRLATAREQLTTSGRVAPALDREIDDAVTLARRIPVVGARIAREVRRQRAESAYWQGDYAALAPAAAGTSDAAEDDPVVMLLVANARFRNAVVQHRTPQALSRSLNDVLSGYAELLKQDPASADAAYNYEFVVRLRAALASTRGATLPMPQVPDMQGDDGEPPVGSDKSEFKVIVPLRPEERQDQMDPGEGIEFKRKG